MDHTVTAVLVLWLLVGAGAGAAVSQGKNESAFRQIVQ
jgi:hypothetical protein